ncbi:hypothetical protein ACJMK2_009105 [Sinanodonta woodiana]|uniref:BTB domain-containing protein n=1 Tax=Sinanodonta woodiana TaxID=1069815 RepID=A0ABD3VBH1_SINWO
MAAVDINWQAQRDVLSSNRYMFENHVACDVTFFIGKQRQKVTAHKYVLISRSSVFYAMLCGLLQETGPVNIPDIEPEVFEQFLRYVYFEAFEPDDDSIMALLYAAKKYAVETLVDKCVSWLKEGISVDNVCSILQQAHAFDEQNLQKKCLEFIMDNGSSVLKHSSFRNLSSECVEIVISQDELFMKEEEIYEATKDWAGNECARKSIQPSAENMRQVMGGLKDLIRFSVMDGKYFTDIVAGDNILSNKEKVSLFRHFYSSSNLGNTNIQKRRVRKLSFQEKQRVVRFPNSSVVLSNESVLQAIDFKCSNEVLLHGIVIYEAIPRIPVTSGSDLSNRHSSVIVPSTVVQLLDESNRTIVSMERQIRLTGEALLDVLLDEPVVLKKMWYTITLFIPSAVTTRSGVSGEKVVNMGDGQSIEFRDSSLSASSTNVLSGQIPGLLLSRKR